MKKTTKPKATPSTAALAYSYIRFSTREQRKGDSLRRQTKAATDWCKKNDVRLDTSTTLHDLGKSAFTGKHRDNPDRNALAAFLAMVESGRVPDGSYLIVESLDRLTREDIVPAVNLLTSLLLDGIRIVQLLPAEKVYDRKSEMHDLMLMIVELMRGNSESRVKSERVGKAWKEKREAARSNNPQPSRREDRVGGMKLLTHQLPFWVEEKDGKLVAIPKRAAVVKNIFQLAAAGHGLVTIIKQLNARKVASFGKSGRWTKPYVNRILRDRRALGEYQAYDHGKPDGDPIPNYYPAVATESEFYAAMNPATPRRPGPPKASRIGKHVDLFAGLLRDARGGNYNATTRHMRILLNNTALDGRAVARTFPVAVFEKAMLRHLSEIEPKEITGGGDDGPDEVTHLTLEKAGIESAIAKIDADMDEHGETPGLMARMRKREAQLKEVNERLADARARAQNPVTETWVEFRSLAEVLEKSKDPADTRVRIRAALRRSIKEIVLLVVPRGAGRDRFCMVAVVFNSGERRFYRIWYQSANHGRPARWASRSFVYAEVDQIDLTKPEEIAQVERVYSNLPEDELDEYFGEVAETL